MGVGASLWQRHQSRTKHQRATCARAPVQVHACVRACMLAFVEKESGGERQGWQPAAGVVMGTIAPRQ